mgnify:CR=1 FL=1
MKYSIGRKVGEVFSSMGTQEYMVLVKTNGTASKDII